MESEVSKLAEKISSYEVNFVHLQHKLEALEKDYKNLEKKHSSLGENHSHLSENYRSLVNKATILAGVFVVVAGAGMLKVSNVSNSVDEILEGDEIEIVKNTIGTFSERMKLNAQALEEAEFRVNNINEEMNKKVVTSINLKMKNVDDELIERINKLPFDQHVKTAAENYWQNLKVIDVEELTISKNGTKHISMSSQNGGASIILYGINDTESITLESSAFDGGEISLSDRRSVVWSVNDKGMMHSKLIGISGVEKNIVEIGHDSTNGVINLFGVNKEPSIILSADKEYGQIDIKDHTNKEVLTMTLAKLKFSKIGTTSWNGTNYLVPVKSTKGVTDVRNILME